MIELDGVIQHYGVQPVLRGISLRIERGEVVVILGPNGMGKTTLLGVMAGVLTPQRGVVMIDGKRRRGSEDEELAIRRMTVFLPDQAWLPLAQTGRDFLLAVGRLYEEIATRIVVLRDGEILAFDTLDGLQLLTGHRGTLSEVLERLIFPETTNKLKTYFEEFER